MRRWLLAGGLAAMALGGCKPNYSPDTYAANAVQQANKVEQGVLVGVRQVDVSAAGTVGTVTGAAAGGIAGSQIAGGPVSAITALGGSLVGGIAGSAVEHASADTTAFEYIVRKSNGDLVSVTQKDKVPLALGQKVLVISGAQARVVPDYTLPAEVSAKLDKPAKPVVVKPPEPPKPEAPPAEAGDAKPAEPAAPNQAPAGAAAPEAGSTGVAPVADKPADAKPADPAPSAPASPATPPPASVSAEAPAAADKPAAPVPMPAASANPAPAAASGQASAPTPAATP